jgi:hypothetical protein
MSEPPDDMVDPWSWAVPLPDVASVEGHLVWIDASSEAPFPIAYRNGIGGPGVLTLFGDSDASVGRTFKIGIDDPLRDFAGNAAVGEDDTFTVLDVGPVVTRLDLDDGPAPGIHGAATYYAPGAPGSPCEAGGCVALEGTSGGCDYEFVGVPGVLALRLDLPPEHRVSLRYRAFSDSPEPLQTTFEDSGGCLTGHYEETTQLPSPDGPYTHATEWVTVDNFSCTSASADLGYVVGPACRYYVGPAIRTRVVVEWIEVTKAPATRTAHTL